LLYPPAAPRKTSLLVAAWRAGLLSYVGEYSF
jgi:hypothetical protein